MAIETLTASEFLGRAVSGRSRPMQCQCENAAGELIDVYVKSVGFHADLTSDYLVAELVANAFACDLKLPAATPYLVKIDPEFVDSLPDNVEGNELRKSFNDDSVIAFGSKQFSPVRRWNATDLVRKPQREAACSLYLFDTIVENSDRGIDNPNLLVSGTDFKVIDFGHSFQRCHSDGDYNDSPFPWQKMGILNGIVGNLQHVMFKEAQKAEDQDFSNFLTVLQNLNDNKIQGYIEDVPPSWSQDTACKIIDYLLEARNHAVEFIERAKGVLR